MLQRSENYGWRGTSEALQRGYSDIENHFCDADWLNYPAITVI